MAATKLPEDQPDGVHPRPVVEGVVLMSLVPNSTFPATDRDKRISEVALELQKTAMGSGSVEIATFLHVGEWAVDRMTEIIGRIGSAGEQLGLALAASRDARRWIGIGARPEDEIIAVRAHAEMITYWTLGTTHGLGNVLLRMLVLNDAAREIVLTEYKDAQGFPPFDEGHAAWVSFGPRLIRTAKNAAEAIHSPALDAIVNAFAGLVVDARWDSLMALRGQNFHRWRPQSVAGGTPKRSTVQKLPHGQTMITVGTGPSNESPDHVAMLKAADEGLDALTFAACTLDDQLAQAVVDLGLPIFNVLDRTTPDED